MSIVWHFGSFDFFSGIELAYTNRVSNRGIASGMLLFFTDKLAMTNYFIGKRYTDLLYFECMMRKDDDSMKLICFPHAGGFSAYYSFIKNNTPDGIDEVFLFDYPSRNDLHGVSTFSEYIESAVDFLLSLGLERNDYIIFGHSMGAFVACEAALIMQNEYDLPPFGVIASGQNPPYLLKQLGGWVCPENEAAFVRKLGGIPDYISGDDRAFRFFLEFIRADMKIMESYVPTVPDPDDRLPLGMIVFGRDDIIIRQNCIYQWNRTFREISSVNVIQGNHFYFDTSGRELLRLIGNFAKKSVIKEHYVNVY